MKCSKCKNDPVRIERCEIARVDSWTNKPCVAPTQLPLGILNKPIDITKVTYCAPLPYKKIVPTPPPLPPPPPPPPGLPTIYLFNVNDWATTKQYVTHYSIIFCWMTIDTLPSDESRQLVADMKVVFAIEIDTQPYYPRDAPAWYNVFYTVLAPYSSYHDISNVTDPDFQKFFGTSVPCAFDYNVDLSQKVSGVKNWTGDSCGWGYKRYEQGAIIEIPYDGCWKSADWLGKYVDAISSILLNVNRPASVLYLGGYTSGAPEGWHTCYPIDNCWKALAQARGWRVVDLR